MLQSMAGLITMGFVISALFLLRFWIRTGNALFAAFAVAFCLLALNHGLVALIEVPREELNWVNLLRSIAFALIIGAIVSKNLRSAGRRSSPPKPNRA